LTWRFSAPWRNRYNGRGVIGETLPMSENEDEEELDMLWSRLRFANGQIHMLIGFLLAVIDTHPDPSELNRHFELAEQITLANSEAALIAEEYIDGELDVSKRLKNALERALARRGDQRKGPDQG
jgi:hypothetical protein